jgi:hypothetical protein
MQNLLQCFSRAGRRVAQGAGPTMLATCLFALPSLASTASLTVGGAAEIYTAGQITGTAAQVLGLNLIPGGTLTFTATGFIGGAGCTSTTPDGCDGFDSQWPTTGVARYTGAAQALVGIFLDDSTPSGPGGVTYYLNPGSGSFAPGLLQPFFIGDGLTGTGLGSLQAFLIPTGATRLFLGTSDNPGRYSNNTGSFQVTVDDLQQNSQLSEAPEPSTYVMMGTSLAALAAWRRRRTAQLS